MGDGDSARTEIATKGVGFPMPPSANNLFLNIPGRGRVKGPKYREYEREVQIWCMRNHSQLQSWRALVGQRRATQALALDVKFKFNSITIIKKKDGLPKRLDLDNRLKALVDCLFVVIGIDDCYLWKISVSKNLTTGPEEADVELSLTPIT